jgi:hypothetical protein
MGHAGLKITDTVYLKRIAPSLSASAQKVGAYIWGLLNPSEAGRAHCKGAGDGDTREAPFSPTMLWQQETSCSD